MKKYFFTGLAIILPIVITYVVTIFFVNLISNPLLPIMRYFVISMKDNALLSIPKELITPLARLLVILFILFLVVLVGLLGRMFLLRSLIELGDKIIHGIPFINKIYKAVQDVMHNLFHQERPSFSKVVLVPFPHSRTSSIGFVTQETLPTPEGSSIQPLVSVFVPETPNPTMGFMLMVPKEQLTPIAIPFEDAIKIIVSCGVVIPEKFLTP